MWYQVSQALWKRLFAAVVMWFFFTKIAKHKFMNNGAKDSHDSSLRDTTGHT
jgi:hypothetical protein